MPGHGHVADEVRRLLAIDAASDQADHQACATLMSTWRMCASAPAELRVLERAARPGAAAAMARPAIAR